MEHNADDRRRPHRPTVKWNSSANLTATLTDSTGLRVRKTGGSPLQVGGTFAAGKLGLSIVGPPAKQAFAVQLFYSRAAGTAEAPVTPNEPAVRLSPVPQTLAGLRGPQLGAPPSTDAARALGFNLTDHPGLSSSLLQAINQLRRSRGLPTITASPALARAAQAHVRALAASGQFSHDWSDGTPFATWIRRYYTPPKTGTWTAGENLVWSLLPRGRTASRRRLAREPTPPTHPARPDLARTRRRRGHRHRCPRCLRQRPRPDYRCGLRRNQPAAVSRQQIRRPLRSESGTRPGAPARRSRARRT